MTDSSATAQRRKTGLIAVWVTPAERATITANAALIGQKVSVYLRTLGMGYVPTSKLDPKHVGDLLAVCGELGEIRALLKEMVTDTPGRAARESDLMDLIDQIQAARADIVRKVADL